MAIHERDTHFSVSDTSAPTQPIESPTESKKQVKKPKITPRFDLLDSPPEGHRITGTQIYEHYIGERMRDYFAKHGEPSPQDWMPVQRTLRAVFGGDYTRERQKWEKSHHKKLPT